MADYITIRKAEGSWVVRAGGAVLAESSAALELIEGDMPPVIYFPRDDIGMAFLEPSDTASACVHKGAASYYDIEAKSGPIRDAAWSYEDPKPAAAEIKGYIAFAKDRVAVEEF